MKKDFKKWHSKKILVNEIKNTPFFHEREIWFCFLGANVGFEQDGKGEDFLRPVLIVRKFSKETFWAIPLTKTKKKDRPYYYSFSFVKEIESVAVLSQLRLIDARRLSYMIGEIKVSDFRKLIEKLKELFP